MKNCYFCWLLFLAAFFCFASVVSAARTKTISESPPIEDGIPAMIKESIIKNNNEIFKNFTNLFQDAHPSVAAPIKAITTCIEKKELVGILHIYANKLQVLNYKEVSTEVRQKFCKDNSYIHPEIYDCIRQASTPENKKFIHAFFIAVKLHFELSCKDVEEQYKITGPFKLATNGEFLTAEIKRPESQHLYKEYLPIKRLSNITKHGVKPTEADYCLPLRVAEAYEITMIKSRKTPFEFRGRAAVAAHVMLTIISKLPFKTLEECS